MSGSLGEVSGKGDNSFDVSKEMNFSRRQSQDSHILVSCSAEWVFWGRTSLEASSRPGKKLGATDPLGLDADGGGLIFQRGSDGPLRVLFDG